MSTERERDCIAKMEVVETTAPRGSEALLHETNVRLKQEMATSSWEHAVKNIRHPET